MSGGDHQRKTTLAEYGFRLPSAIDNRPLRFHAWDAMRPQSTFVSATPGRWEMEQTGGVFTEQVILPPGLVDPPVTIRPIGRASWREGVSQDVYISVVAGSLKTTNKH